MRVVIRVQPRSGRLAIGGEHEGALVVRVVERAVDGRATAAALGAVAEAFGIARTRVVLVSGATSRTKVLELPGPDAPLAARLAELLAR